MGILAGSFDCDPTTSRDLIDTNGDGMRDTLVGTCVHRTLDGSVAAPGAFYEVVFIAAMGASPTSGDIAVSNVQVADGLGLPVAAVNTCASTVVP